MPGKGTPAAPEDRAVSEAPEVPETPDNPKVPGPAGPPPEEVTGLAGDLRLIGEGDAERITEEVSGALAPEPRG